MHARTLIELAMQHTNRKSLRPFGELVGVSHAKISEWKNGESPMPEERIRQIARLAAQDPGPWLLMIKSEQDDGELGREWAKLARKLAATATLLAVAVFPALHRPAQAAESGYQQPDTRHYAKWRVDAGWIIRLIGIWIRSKLPRSRGPHIEAQSW